MWVKDLIEYSSFAGWVNFFFFFPVEIMFLSHPLLFKKHWLEKSKMKLMVSVQIVNVFDSEYIMIKNNFLTGAMTHWEE